MLPCTMNIDYLTIKIGETFFTYFHRYLSDFTRLLLTRYLPITPLHFRYSARHTDRLILLSIQAWGTFLELGKESFLPRPSRWLRGILASLLLSMVHLLHLHWGVIHSHNDHNIVYTWILNIWRGSVLISLSGYVKYSRPHIIL